MALVRVSALMSMILAASGCGWNPPSAAPPQPDTCTPADGPTAAAVDAGVATIAPPSAGGAWKESARGHTADCALTWIQVTPSAAAPDSAQQVLFFDGDTALGTPTPEPRPYVTVTANGDVVSVQYQWRQGDDEPCCPTGIGTVRFELTDGKLLALDPVPGP